jgi:hypothetical protein
VAANGALTDIVIVQCRGRGGTVVFEVQNKDAAIALQDFALLVQAHENGSWVSKITGAAWTSENLVGGVTPQTLAAASRAVVAVNIGAAWAIKFQARAASSSITVVVRGTLNEGLGGGSLGPDSLTFTRVKIDQTAAAGQTVLIAADGTKVMRLHRLYVRMAAAGDLTIEAAAGTDLSGPMPMAATGVVDLKFEPSKAGAHVATAAGAGLAILTTQKVYGFAIVSSAAN